MIIFHHHSSKFNPCVCDGKNEMMMMMMLLLLLLYKMVTEWMIRISGEKNESENKIETGKKMR